MYRWTVIVAASVLCFGLAVPSGASTARDPFETRCGWFANPTPANIWLDDRDGQWIIGTQGGYQIEDDWPWPDFDAKRPWVKTNNNYGYGCACLEVRTDPASRHVLAIRKATAKPIEACRRDPALRKWEQDNE